MKQSLAIFFFIQSAVVLGIDLFNLTDNFAPNEEPFPRDLSFTNPLPKDTGNAPNFTATDPCSYLHQCNGSEDTFRLPCMCDEECHAFGDCCADVPPRAPKLSYLGYYSCHSGEMYHVARCPDNTDEKLRQLCEADVGQNILLDIFVVDNSTGFVFRNKYCAQCHAIPKDNLVFFNLATSCPQLFDEGHNMTTIDNAIYDQTSSKWIIENTGILPEYPCAWEIETPFSAKFQKRSCLHPLTSSCSPTWPDDDVRAKCGSDKSPVRVGKMWYRNVHCALCRNESMANADCFLQINFFAFAVPSFRILVDMNAALGDKVDQTSVTCPADYAVFDGECRKISCGLESYKMVKGKCVKRNRKVLD